MLGIVDKLHEISIKYADHPAILTEKERISYGDFYSQMNRLSSYLNDWFWKNKGRSISSSDVIGISLEKSADLYISMFAIIASGASYVPIDPQLNSMVKEHIIGVCDCNLIITNDFIDIFLSSPFDFNELNTIPQKVDLEQVCYVIFTSGTTGQPKGVPIKQESLLNLVSWAIPEWNLSPDSRVIQYSTINFDASILDIFPTLLAGATLCIPDKDQIFSANLLAEFCEFYGINHAFLPPSLLSVLDSEKFNSIKQILTGGESISRTTFNNWKNGRKIYNLYGPTECTVLASFKVLNDDEPINNIGKPIGNMDFDIYAEDGLLSNKGELYISGVGLSDGYLKQQQETDSKFYNKVFDCKSTFSYKTGDLVERMENGDLLFLGRVDRQIKLRGYRIELEEIEYALMELGYQEVALTVKNDSLVAYVVALDKPCIHELKGKLLNIISEYKVPHIFHFMENMPYKLNGKIDYQALKHEDFLSLNLKSPFENDGKYQELIKLWCEELRISLSDVNLNSNFKDLGGTSINIIKLLAKLEHSFKKRINFFDFFNQPTINFLYTCITSEVKNVNYIEKT